MNTFLAIDLGTSNCRSAVLDNDMNILSVSSKAYPIITLSSLRIEQDASLWWDAVKQTVKDAVLKAGEAGKAVKSISISSQGIAMVPIDINGTPLYNAVSWLDMHATEEEKLIEEQFNTEIIFDITGKRASEVYTFAKLISFKNEHPDIYDKAYKILLPMDYILYKFCKKAVTDHSMASGTMFYDINAQSWSDTLLDRFNLDKDKLPEIAWSGTPANTILPELADELGLNKNVIISVGAQDQKCAALGAGINSVCATASLGTASCITKLSEKPVKDKKLRIPCFSYLYPKTWSYEGIINTAASSYQWFKNTFAPALSYNDLNALAEKHYASNEHAVFYPYLSGMTSPFWGNATGCFNNLSLSSDIGQLALAVMEGVSCNIKANLDVMDSCTPPLKELRLFGGGAASKIWCQLTADITNMRVITLKSPETALVGAAMLAYHSIYNCYPKTNDTAKIFDPNPERVSYYKDYYSLYIEGLNGKYIN